MVQLEYSQRRKLHLARLTTRKEIQIPRKIWHIVMGTSMGFLYLNVVTSQALALLILGVLGGILITLDFYRLKNPALNRFTLQLLGPITRREEVHSHSAMVSFIIAAFIAIAVFPRPIAALSFILLGCADPAASVVGILFGKDSLWNGKSVQGSLACFVVSFIIILIFVSNQHLAATAFLPIAFIGALAITIAELGIIKIDDNFSVPIFGGAAIWLTLTLLG
ncbi:diacylglycerol/polyprenol kinase family protein [Bdellovibrionota bacterium]